MTSPAFLGALCLALSCLGGAHGLWRSDDLEWSKLIMVHHWPATVCQEVESHCKDPPNYWTIHGLWPDKSEVCNRSWPFNPKEIKDLLPDMRRYWPDLLHPSNYSHQFWSHEWKKHGTCAAQLDALNSQRKYFGKSLDLYKALALTSMLQKLGIEPSTDHYYQVSDIRDALVSVYKVVPKVQCFLLEKGRCRLKPSDTQESLQKNRTPEEDLNLDSEPAAEDTVGEATDKVDPPSLETKTAALAETLRNTPPPKSVFSPSFPVKKAVGPLTSWCVCVLTRLGKETSCSCQKVQTFDMNSLVQIIVLTVEQGLRAATVAELELLIAVASLSAEHELSGSDSQALEHGLSTCSPWAQ
ncbi:hypothetical protein MG293_010464 [Ovis ammon polii]|uniref:Uncharacterized protein n=1 Tax=Ovis ammon polii TaxID=230172 RepID=A0AAD4U3B6_OVIAM|nr:hypothetical protein MG293_010464 [Ovis ammon polii]